MMVTRFRDSDLIHTSAEGLNIYYLIIFTSSHQWKINECCLTPVLRTINTLRPKQNVRHFADDIFRCILFNKWYNWQYISIGSGNGLALNRGQAITWTNDDSIQWPIYASPGLNELRYMIHNINFLTQQMKMPRLQTFSSLLRWWKSQYHWKKIKWTPDTELLNLAHHCCYNTVKILQHTCINQHPIVYPWA